MFAQGDVDALFASKYGAGTPGVAVAVVHDGKVAFQKGYGTASLEFGQAVSPRTVFQAGSVSKQFTAFAIYLLERQGKLSLEDDARQYVPEIAGFSQPIRIKHLLAHTSGLRDQAGLLTMAGWRMDDVMTTSQVLRVLSRQKELNFEPGSAYLYCNSGYTVLAAVVRRVTGKPFAAFAREAIFAPLGMHDTQFQDDHELVIRNRADSYWKPSGGGYKRTNLNDSADGPSNLYTTVEDMAKWALNLERPVVGDAELIRRFNEPSLLNNGERAVYYSLPGDVGYHAKGQVQRVFEGLRVWSHGGHAGGFRSTFWRFPDQRFAVVLLSNDEHFAQLDHAEAIVRMYLKDSLRPVAAAPVPTPQRAPATAAAPKVRLEGLCGVFYSDELETLYTATVADGKLALWHIRHGEIALTPVAEDRFRGRIEFPVDVEFVRNGEGEAAEMRVSNFGAKNVRFQRLKR